MTLVMVVLNISIKASMSERKIRFNFNFESMVKRIPIWAKAGNGNDVKRVGVIILQRR